MNILVIDDELLILQNVLARLSEMELDDEIDSALSAAEAREKAAKKSYQIFLCDIVMPEEDGISFAKWALSEFPESKFIFLTAHADYSYMKAAISLNSFDYILQPAEPEELKNALIRAKMQISIEEKNRRLIRTGAFYSDKESEILGRQAWSYLTGGTGDDTYLKRYMELRFGEFRADRKYYCFYVQALGGENWEEKDRPLLRSIYYNILDELFDELPVRYQIFLGWEQKASFFCLTAPETGGSGPGFSEMKEKYKTLQTIFVKLLRMECALYYAPQAEYGKLPETCGIVYQEVAENVKHQSGLFAAGQLSGLTRDEDSFEAQEATWKTLLSQNRISDFEKSVFRYMDFCICRNEVNRSFMMKLHQVVSEQLLAYMVANDVYSNQVFDEECSYYDFMFCWTQVDTMKKALSHVVEKLYENLEMPGNDVVQSAVRYIRQNISDDILVTEIAEWVGLNPGYLTRLFKKKMGISLKKYIDREKMDTAKNLLLSTDLPVTVISSHVGYMNYSNFSRSFKLLVGCTPSEFRAENGAGKTE